jgi:hypothetical protein
MKKESAMIDETRRALADMSAEREEWQPPRRIA